MRTVYVAMPAKGRAVSFAANSTAEAIARAQGIANTAKSRVVVSRKICSRLVTISTVKPR